MDSEDTIGSHEMISTLKSELAALQFKRDRLISEVGIRGVRAVGLIEYVLNDSRSVLCLAARHQGSVTVQGPKDGGTRGRDGNAQGAAGQAELDHRQLEEPNKSEWSERARHRDRVFVFFFYYYFSLSRNWRIKRDR